MNYRHAYHAGNFADVVKHMTLARLLVYLTRKEAPLFYLDVHAGIGRYDLSGEEASKTGEWRDGVGRLDAPFSPAVEELLAPYRGALAQTRARHGAGAYPGSPALAQALTRRGDRLLFCEKHPDDARLLRSATQWDPRAKTLEMDGWMGLRAHSPPKERRGLVLLDPPFEEPGEIERMARALTRAWAKWPTGVYALWAPIKEVAATRALGAAIVDSGARRVLWLESIVGAAEGPAPRGGGPPLTGTAMAIVNPPFTLADEMRTALPALTERLARRGPTSWRVETLAGE
jgi:23S rRNA (adenine2030-N6)-methyltransferase